MLWGLAALLIPVFVALLLFFSAADDFWQVITFKVDLSRLFGDLIHVLVILLVGVVAELFVLFMLFTTLF